MKGDLPHADRMTLDGEALEDFKRRYENAFSIRLSDEEARELEANLKHLYRIVRRRSAGRDEPPALRLPWCNPSQDRDGVRPQLAGTETSRPSDSDGIGPPRDAAEADRDAGWRAAEPPG